MGSMLRRRRAPQVNRLPSKPGMRRLLWIGGLRILVLGIAAFFLVSCGSSSGGEQAEGEAAPDFTIPTNAGNFTLSEQRGNVVFLFYSSPE